jgi:protease II
LDIYRTVQDPSSSALVVHEYDEWGQTDGSSPEALEYIRSYSPCENIPQTPSPTLPAVLVSVGMLDDKVSPEESLRWMKLLRQRVSQQKCSPPLLLHLSAKSGHEGSLAMTEQFRDQAMEMVFLESNLNTAPPGC